MRFFVRKWGLNDDFVKFMDVYRISHDIIVSVKNNKRGLKDGKSRIYKQVHRIGGGLHE